MNIPALLGGLATFITALVGIAAFYRTRNQLKIEAEKVHAERLSIEMNISEKVVGMVNEQMDRLRAEVEELRTAAFKLRSETTLERSHSRQCDARLTEANIRIDEQDRIIVGLRAEVAQLRVEVAAHRSES